jgi:hypothetical protein
MASKGVSEPGWSPGHRSWRLLFSPQLPLLMEKSLHSEPTAHPPPPTPFYCSTSTPIMEQKNKRGGRMSFGKTQVAINLPKPASSLRVKKGSGWRHMVGVCIKRKLQRKLEITVVVERNFYTGSPNTESWFLRCQESFSSGNCLCSSLYHPGVRNNVIVRC